MFTLKLFFWLSLFIVFYSYIGYGILIWLLVKIKRLFHRSVQPAPGSHLPTVTLITAVFNEASIIEKKIENTFALSYPREKLRILFIADGSTDETADIISRYPSVELLYKPQREGKVAAINRAMQYVDSEIVVFCDGNTFLNVPCIEYLVRHYADAKVGAVAGEKKIIDTSGDTNVAGEGEGLYWKYESFLKKMDSEFYTVVGAAGELFSIRTALYHPVEKNILLDDFMISLEICMKGYRVVYEPQAFASEEPSVSLRDEQKRKIRISAGGIQSVILLKGLLNIFKYGRLSFQYISHRFLRWIACPPLLPALFILNILIVYKQINPVYTTILIAQILFYAAAFTGWIFTFYNIKIKALYVPYYLLFMNISMYFGVIRYFKKSQSVLWEKANRKIVKQI